MSRERTHRDRMARAKTGWKMGLTQAQAEAYAISKAHGRFIFDLRDLSGRQLAYFEKDNLIVLDAGIQAARLFKDPLEPSNGINMLAVGTGATGALLSPDTADPRQRKLNAEIARKGFSSSSFRDSGGTAVSYPTNIVDFTTTFGEAEAVGALNEMGVISTISDNPSTTNPNPETFPSYTNTLDISGYDVQINYLTFGVVVKPSASILTITWRLSF
jgi:hypothetical protein